MTGDRRDGGDHGEPEPTPAPTDRSPAPKVSEILRRKSRDVMVLLFVVAILGPIMLLAQYQFAQRSSTIYTPVVDTTSRLLIAMRWAQSDLRVEQAYGVPEASDQLRVRESEARNAVADLERVIGDRDDFSEPLSELTGAIDRWWELVDSATGFGSSVNPDTTSGPAPDTGPLSADDQRDASDAFTTVIVSSNALNDIASDKRVEVRLWRSWILIGGSTVAMIMTLVVGLALIRGTRRTAAQIVDPIEALHTVARLDADGGRGARAHTDEGPAEVRDLAAAFNTLLDTRDRFEAGRDVYVERLEELDRQKDEFISTVSHELRTPLASIIGYTEMLEEGDAGDLTDRQQKMMSVVQRNADRLQGLIEDLLVISRIQSHGLDTDHQPVRLDSVVTRVVESLSPAAARAGLALGVDIDPILVSGDALQLERAVTNLLSNAVKFTPEGGSVDISLHASEGTATIAVADTGIGIPAAEHANLGTRFFRSTTAQRASIPGTGLGLSIVHAIADAHEGTLEFDSEEGMGTTFRLSVPTEHLPSPTEHDPSPTAQGPVLGG